jgi:hypothetical protein
MRMKWTDEQVARVFRILCRIGSVGVAFISGWALFFVIVPFFLLGIHRIDPIKLVNGAVYYGDAFGIEGWALTMAVLALIPARLFTLMWLFSLMDFIVTRKWFIVPILIVAPLAVAYVFGGPYAYEFTEWLFNPD